MNGLAKKLFRKRSQKTLFEENKKNHWPLLEIMFAHKRLGYVDLSMTYQFLSQKSITDEAVACFFCHLSMATRKGHVCVKINDGAIIPSPEEIWVSDEIGQIQELSSETFEILKAFIVQGSEMFLPSLVFQANHAQDILQVPIVKYNHSFYLQRYWHLETVFLTEVKKKLMGQHSIKPIDVSIVKNKIKQFIVEGKLLKEQSEAILNASQTLLTLITGGPGTGKTYTAGILLRTIWEVLEDHEKEDFIVVLAAPTGKAAANLEESIQKALSGTVGFPAIKAQTLHQLLGLKKNGFREPSPLNADLVLIDESSMIDIKLMGQLFLAIKPGSRLIMLEIKINLPLWKPVPYLAI